MGYEWDIRVLAFEFSLFERSSHKLCLLQLPDYHDIIKHPMDFGTVRKKLDDGLYTDLEHFEVGAAIFRNSFLEYT